MQLNEEQQKIIKNCRSNQLVMAPAGTGKTTVISQMIDKLCITMGVPEQDILCITFTNRARNEMLTKISQRDVEVRTIHSLYYRLIQMNYAKFGYVSPDILIVSPQTMMDFVDRIAMDLGAPNLGKNKIYNFCTIMCKEAVNYTSWNATLVRLFSITKYRRELQLTMYEEWSNWLKQFGSKFMQEYMQRAIAENIVDFNLMEYFCWNLSETADAVELMAHKKYLLVDEIQDTTRTEFTILTRFFANAVLSLYGDFNQTIYEWRGSNPGYIRKEFMNNFHPSETCLAENYRSTPEILYWSQNVLDNVNKTEVCAMLPAPTEKLKVYLCGTRYGDRALNILKQWYADDPCGKYCVLARNRNTLDSIKSAWVSRSESETIPFGIGLPHEFEVNDTKSMKLFGELVGIAAQPYNEFLINRILSRFGINKQTGKAPYAYLISGMYTMDIRRDYYADLQESIDNKTLWIIDIESTDKSIETARIVQIAAMNAVTKEEINIMVNPEVPVGESARVHGFTNEFLDEHGKDLKESLQRVVAKINGGVIAGHNVWYDITVINEELARCGIPELKIKQVYDTLTESRKLLQDLNLPNYRLDTVRQALGITFEATHNAMDDVIATTRVFAKLTGLYIFPNREKLHKEMIAEYDVNKYIIEQLKTSIKRITEGDFIGQLDWCRSMTSATNSRELEVDYLNSTALTALTGRCRAAEIYSQLTINKSEIDLLMLKQSKIPAITIHQSKGCEFDRVILLDCIGQRFCGQLEEVTNEEMRVFYVGMTRAKKELVVVTNAKSQYSVSDKINYITQDLIEYIDSEDKDEIRK